MVTDASALRQDDSGQTWNPFIFSICHGFLSVLSCCPVRFGESWGFLLGLLSKLFKKTSGPMGC